MSMKKTLCLILIVLCANLCMGVTTLAEATSSVATLNEPQPLRKTDINLLEKDLRLIMFEDHATAMGEMRLSNPGERKVSLTLRLRLPAQSTSLSGSNAKPQVKVFSSNNEAYKVYTNNRLGYCQWDLTFDPGESLSLYYEYPWDTPLNEEDHLNVSYRETQKHNWKTYGKSSFILEFQDLHPGLIQAITPSQTEIDPSSFIWTWSTAPLQEKIEVSFDVYADQRAWEALLSAEEQRTLHEHITAQLYIEASHLMAAASDKASREDYPLLKAGQAYFLDKAQRAPEATRIWKTLYDRESAIARVYWVLGSQNLKQTSRLADYYDQAKEQQVHPLVVQWLAAQLPAKMVKTSPPEKIETSTVSNEESRNGILLKASAFDRDGDITRLQLRYHWENEPMQVHDFQLQPFKYEHPVTYFVSAPHFFTRLSYEFTATDSTGHETQSGEKEILYLNNTVKSTITYRFWAANLLLADFEPTEETKVYNWFKSYMKMAKDAKFLDYPFQTPYIVFVGTPSQFPTAKPDILMHYTPAPFKPKTPNINLELHRFYLSYLFGEGWSDLPPKQLQALGDALLLGKGHNVLMFKYLQHKDDNAFHWMLKTIGQGGGWPQSLEEVFGMSPARAKFNALWFVFGNFVLAFFLIILFAWLGKNGHIVRLIQFLKHKKT